MGERIDSLMGLLNRVESLKNQVMDEARPLIGEDLQGIFNDLKQYLTPAELETGLVIMDDATLMLKKKIDEIGHFIALISQRDSVLAFIQNEENENILGNIIQKAWFKPLYMPHLSYSFLMDSFTQLTGRVLRTPGAPPVFTPEKLHPKEPVIMNDTEKPFGSRMQAFLLAIEPKLPCTLAELLANDPSPDAYFEHFSLLLHLLQSDCLSYDRNSKTFSMRNKNLGEKLNLYQKENE